MAPEIAIPSGPRLRRRCLLDRVRPSPAKPRANRPLAGPRARRCGATPSRSNGRLDHRPSKSQTHREGLCWRVSGSALPTLSFSKLDYLMKGEDSRGTRSNLRCPATDPRVRAARYVAYRRRPRMSLDSGRASALARPRLGIPAGDCASRAARTRARLEIIPGRGGVVPSGLSCQNTYYRRR